MELNINNFAKIEKADITIDGITVIAGENNTGKSTVGKILFSLFNSLQNVDERILDERFKEIETTTGMILQNNNNILAGDSSSNRTILYSIYLITRKINDDLQKKMKEHENLNELEISQIVNKILEAYIPIPVRKEGSYWSVKISMKF